MPNLSEAIAEMEAHINAEAEKRAMEKVAKVFARVLLTLNDGKVDYELWAEATIKALNELPANGEPAASA